jgi:beta-phosphoglucomutase-like phosphatase (HAD superfamily)
MIEQSIKHYLEKHGFESMSLKAVLFDMDGVLYNSMPHHAIAWHESMKEYGIDMPYSDAYRYEGMRGVETIKLLAREQLHKELTHEEAQQMYDTKSAHFAALGPAENMEGVEALMRQIKASDLTIGVVTGSGQLTLLNNLCESFHGLLHPEHIVTSFDVSHGKPAPDPYLMGLRKCGVEPWEAMVVKNAPLGVRAAVRARMFAVAANTGPLPDQTLSAEGANLVFKKMKDLSDCWEELIAFSPCLSPKGKERP